MRERERERERERDREIRKIVNPLIYIHHASYKIAHIMKIHSLTEILTCTDQRFP